jgi:5-(carboxyamino)imidazole ribonucleotide synthase
MFQKIGILGAGQLGRMLWQCAVDWNLEVHFLDNDKNAPCKELTNNFVLGNITNYQDVYNFGKNLDLITIEIENVNTKALSQLEKEGKKIFPQPHIIELIQDKGLQKEFYQKNNIPTLPFWLFENKKEVIDFFEKNNQKYFQKMRKGGYDGKGVQKLFSKNEYEFLFDQPSLLESALPLEKEISVLVARNLKGEIKTFPPVEMVFNQELNLVDYLLSPANIDQNTIKKAENLAKLVIEKLNMVGLLAVEMFLDNNHQLYINEIAPRPHNSGHQTIEANNTSQYQQMWRAILNLPLGNTSTSCFSVMLNILGEKGFEGEVFYENLDKILALENVFVHLYGKKITKAGRKMGHITIIGQNFEAIKEKINWIKNNFKVISKS